jgi:hypothetical protein
MLFVWGKEGRVKSKTPQTETSNQSIFRLVLSNVASTQDKTRILIETCYISRLV